MTAESDEKIIEAAKANNEANFSAYFGRVLDDLFIQRMEGNDEIFNRVMSDKRFRTAAQDQLAREVYERIRREGASPAPRNHPIPRTHEDEFGDSKDNF